MGAEALTLNGPVPIVLPDLGLEGGAIPTEDLWHLESIRQWIFAHTGLHFGENKQVILYRRLKTLCWKQGLPGLQEMSQQLNGRTDSQLAVEVARAVSTNHTFFFRELQVLKRVAQAIAPQMADGPAWRIWSAAASSGEEVYTVAILLAEALGLARARQSVALLGTDISYPMIEQAEHAVYGAARLEEVPPQMFKQYFQPVGLGQWRVRPEVRQMCTFRRINLQSVPWPFKHSFHVILCRNVLYYFDLPGQEQLVERLYDVTLPGGWLVTSVTETLHGLRTRWRKVDAGIFRKDEG